MALTSASTIADAYAQYQNNLLWQGDLTKAQNALAAVRYLLMCRPQQIAAETGVSMRFAELQHEKAALEGYVGKLSTTINRAAFTRARANLY